MFFESNRSSRDGMIAVGTVVMNRLRSGNHGNTVCAVVGERGQFAPGVMTRRMNSRAMPDVEEAAEAVLKGERHSKMRSAMFFHTAGLKFPYKNMHYVAVAGGNAFYEKRGRNWQPLPPETQVMVAEATPKDAMPGVETAAKPIMVADAQPSDQPAPGMASAPLPKPRPETASRVASESARTAEEPDPTRFGVAPSAPVMTASYTPESEQPVMAFEATPDNTTAIGALIASESRPMQEY